MKADNSNIAQATVLSQQAIASHKSLINFDDDDARLLKAHGSVIESQIDTIIEQFYQQQMSLPEVKAVIGDEQRLSLLKTTMKKYIQELFAGDYGDEYVARRLVIGSAHERLGVSARYYLSAAYQLENLLRESIDDKDDRSNAPLRAALHKVMQFDVQIVMDDFISKLMTKVRSAQGELEDYAEGLEEVVAERTRQLNELSRKDELTDLFNLDGMRENLRRELANAVRYKESISYVSFAINGYQQLVDKKGQAIGNVVLNQIGHDIKVQIREADVPCRIAEGTFCIIMPRTISKEAEAICQRLIEMFKKNNPHNLSFSMGVATTGPDDVQETDNFIKQGETLMHKAADKTGFNLCAG